MVASLLLGSSCSSAPPSPSEPSPTGLQTPGSAPESIQPSDSGPIVSELAWYEAVRVFDQQNNETRELFVGTLDNRVAAEITLGTRDAAEAEGRTEAFDWVAPQAAGLFMGHVVIWERMNGSATIELVQASDGSVEPLVILDGGVVHVATADGALEQIFYITADEAGTPTGLWVKTLDGRSEPRQLSYEFADRPLELAFGYRLVASADGSQLAVQGGEGEATVFEVSTGKSSNVGTTGPILGIARGQVVAYGRISQTAGRDIDAIDVESGRKRTLFEGVEAGQLVRGRDGPLVAAMFIDPANTLRYEIRVQSFEGGQPHVAYRHELPEIGPLLASPPTSALAAEAPPDWLLVSDALAAFVEGVRPRAPDTSSLPMLLNLLTGQVITVGPFEMADQ